MRSTQGHARNIRADYQCMAIERDRIYDLEKEAVLRPGFHNKLYGIIKLLIYYDSLMNINSH